MYNPKQTGFFPLIQTKVEEGLSEQDKKSFLSQASLEDKIKWIYNLPRVSSAHEDNVFDKIVKPGKHT